MHKTLYLASRSPRRRALLEQIGVAYQTLDVDVDETTRANEVPAEYVERLAVAKAMAGLSSLTNSDAIVLGADTCIALDGDILGKPKDIDDAASMLTRLGGRSHQVLTGIALVRAGEKPPLTAVSVTDVVFCKLDRRAIDAYCECGEGRDKAGAYAIQGRGAVFVKEIKGSYSGVVGLPLYDLSVLLDEIGQGVLYAP